MPTPDDLPDPGCIFCGHPSHTAGGCAGQVEWVPPNVDAQHTTPLMAPCPCQVQAPQTILDRQAASPPLREKVLAGIRRYQGNDGLGSDWTDDSEEPGLIADLVMEELGPGPVLEELAELGVADTDPQAVLGVLQPHFDPIVRALTEALRYFVHLDESNAAIHCAPVRYSPITFRLAEALEWLGDEAEDANLASVLDHRGGYDEDRGR